LDVLPYPISTQLVKIRDDKGGKQNFMFISFSNVNL
jgi:hypothetical protein